MAKIGNCGLCKLQKELMNSHLIPASIFNILMTKNFPNKPESNLIFEDYTRNIAITSSKQVTSYFLCDDCEQLFSKNGEKHVAETCYINDNNFKLLEELNQLKPSHVSSKGILYLGESIRDWQKFLYFATSIFWRASAGKWNSELVQTKISLGEKYQEGLRLYLYGQADFPKNIYLLIDVDSDPIEKTPLIAFPQSNKTKEGFFKHRFTIPCLTFYFFIGNKYHNLKDYYHQHNTNILINSISFKKTNDYDFILKNQCKIEPKGKRLKELTKKINEQKQF